MKAILREVLYWILSLIFAGIMLVGFFAEIGVAPVLGVVLKLALSSVGFVGCAYASNRTSLGRRMCDDAFEPQNDDAYDLNR